LCRKNFACAHDDYGSRPRSAERAINHRRTTRREMTTPAHTPPQISNPIP
jgi:hypothetical protein